MNDGSQELESQNVLTELAGQPENQPDMTLEQHLVWLQNVAEAARQMSPPADQSVND